jgi:ketosteroid isomerase-like protein
MKLASAKSKFAIAATTLAMLLASGCAETPKDTRAADEATIRALDAQWSKSASAKDVAATVGYYAPGASVLAPNAPIASDSADIRAGWTAMLSPDSSLSWQANTVDVARSSDLAYVQGIYQMTTQDATGNPSIDRGKFVEVWKKQPDNSWKVVSDIFNSDMPVKTAATAPAKKSAHKARGKKKTGTRSHHRYTGAQ